MSFDFDTAKENPSVIQIFIYYRRNFEDLEKYIRKRQSFRSVEILDY